MVADAAHARPGRRRPRDRGGRQDHEAAGRTHDLVLLGNDAADSGDFQVGIRLAYELGRPVVNGATTVTVEDGDGRWPRVGEGPEGRRPTGCRCPRWSRSARAASSRATRACTGRMKAKKVQIEERTPAAEPRGPQRVKLLLPPPTPSSVQILGEGAGGRARRRRPASSSWGCWPDDPRPRRDRPRRHGLRGLARGGHLRPRPVGRGRRRARRRRRRRRPVRRTLAQGAGGVRRAHRAPRRRRRRRGVLRSRLGLGHPHRPRGRAVGRGDGRRHRPRQAS